MKPTLLGFTLSDGTVPSIASLCRSDRNDVRYIATVVREWEAAHPTYVIDRVTGHYAPDPNDPLPPSRRLPDATHAMNRLMESVERAGRIRSSPTSIAEARSLGNTLPLSVAQVRSALYLCEDAHRRLYHHHPRVGRQRLSLDRYVRDMIEAYASGGDLPRFHHPADLERGLKPSVNPRVRKPSMALAKGASLNTPGVTMAQRFAPISRAKPTRTRHADAPWCWRPTHGVHPDTGQPYRLHVYRVLMWFRFADKSEWRTTMSFVSDFEERATLAALNQGAKLAANNPQCPVVGMSHVGVLKSKPLTVTKAARVPLAPGAHGERVPQYDVATHRSNAHLARMRKANWRRTL